MPEVEIVRPVHAHHNVTEAHAHKHIGDSEHHDTAASLALNKMVLEIYAKSEINHKRQPVAKTALELGRLVSLAVTNIDHKPLPERWNQASDSHHKTFWDLLDRSLTDRHSHDTGKLTLLDGSTVERRGAEEWIKTTDNKTTHLVFDLHNDHKLLRAELPNGEVWMRQAGTANWRSTEGKEFRGTITNNELATHFQRDDGVIRSIASNGKESITQPDIKIEQFNLAAQNLFARLNKSGNGYLSKDEVLDAFNHGHFTGKDAQVVAALKGNYDNLSNLAENQGLFTPHGITIDDLNAFDTKISKGREQELLAERVEKWGKYALNYLDEDGDGKLSRDELKNPILDPSVTKNPDKMSELTQVLTYLRSQNQDFDSDDLIALPGKIRQQPEVKLINSTSFFTSRTQQAEQNSCLDLYGNKANPLASIRLEAVNQGHIGDCYFLAAVADLAASHPEKIYQMIKTNKDNTYTVTFPNQEPVTVAAPTVQELGLFENGGAYGVWPAVLEKAYGQWKRNADSPAEGGDGGDYLSAGISILTGKRTDSIAMNNNSKDKQAEVDEVLKTKLKSGDVISCGTGSGEQDGLPETHAYSVIGYDPTTKTVTVRNPWGAATGTSGGTHGVANLGGTANGVFNIPLADYCREFDETTYSYD